MSIMIEAETHDLQFYIQWSSLALLFYDYALTLPMEIKYIWCLRYKHCTILYVLCRYALLANVLYLLAITGKLSTRCVPFDSPRTCLNVVTSKHRCNNIYQLVAGS
ncbi:hypothetical protein QCA50_011296 [Cerrena zonata]|uniref:DUF6533 domain-containing protein n=1 Tax=Cerrena zonata TaxID=2478898 RepID=A0AAW0FV24_9APHY